MHPWIYDTEHKVIRFIGPTPTPSAGDWFIWLAQWAAVVALFLVAVGVVVFVLSWLFARTSATLADRHTIKADANGRLPVNRSMVQTGALVQAAYGLVDPALIAPDQRGLLPVGKQLLESGALNEALIALATEYMKTQRPQPNVPAHLTYAPHTSNDRALDVSLAQGIGATGGGAFSLLAQATEDKRFTVAMPDQLDIELPNEVEHVQHD